MDEPCQGINLPSEAVTSAEGLSAAKALAASATSQRLKPAWEPAPDAGASTCVSGSEGSLRHKYQQYQQNNTSQQQQQQQSQQQDMQQSKPGCEILPERVSTPCSGASTLSHSDQRPQLHVPQQNHRLCLHVAALPHSQVAQESSSSDCRGTSLPPAAATVRAVAPQVQRSSSSSSACSGSSIGGDLRGLINALAAAETTAGSGELQQLLQQLLAERDLYKAAFGAAKEELKDLERRQQQLTQALQHSEQERVQQQQQQEAAEAADAAASPQDRALIWNSSSSSSSMQQQMETNGIPASSSCSSAEGPYGWLQQLHACVAAGTYPSPDLLQKSVEEQQQLIRLAEGLQQERESYVEAVACLHSQLREARDDVSLYMSAHATHAADLTAESDEALRAADLWLQHSLRIGTNCKFWGLGSVVHSQEAAAASAARRCTTPVAPACSRSMQVEAAAAAAAVLVTADEPQPGVSVALAAAASVFGMQDDSVGADAGPSGTVTTGAGNAAAATELERLWWGVSNDGYVEKKQLQQQYRQRERNNRLLWFLE